jgi:hypothetical protein
MAIPASGPLSLTDIQTEFGGTNPISLSEYYAGGGLVPAGTTGTYGAVPSSGTISVQNFYGTSNYIPVYIENLFSPFIFTTNTPSNVTVANGINLSGNGGLVWTKIRSTDASHQLYDTVRGGSYQLQSNTTNAQSSSPPNAMQFGSNGFTWLRSGGWSTNDAVSWTFREQPKFFDIVTYTGTGSSSLTVNHNLGSEPGCIIIKWTSGTGYGWYVYHREMSGTPQASCMTLNGTGAAFYLDGDASNPWIIPSSTNFQVATTDGGANASGESYVAYLFAHNAGGFGLTGTDNVISCGSFTGNTTVNLGYEPQWILLKNSGASENWYIQDVARGWPVSGDAKVLYPNLNAVEGDTNQIYPNATGFSTLIGGGTYIYVAIRRGPMKVPTVGTSVFFPSTAATGTQIPTGFPVDLWIGGSTGGDGGAGAQITVDRLRGPKYFGTTSTAAEIGTNNSLTVAPTNTFTNITQGGNRAEWLFGRAPSFCDVVCYTGNDVNGRVLNHNLGVAAEFVIQKKRNSTSQWAATVLSQTNSLLLNTNDAQVGVKYTTASDATTFTIRSSFNGAPDTYVAYLFATCAGVSKVGSYTGTGALQTVNCGFTSGSRYIIIKRYDSTGDWYVWDSARGISSGNDPYLLLNSNAAQVTGTNYVDTDTTGFKVTAAAPAGLNASGGTYVFLAIA